MFCWQRDPAIKALVEADALLLIENYGDAAYQIARQRAAGARRGVVDGNRPVGHWHDVRREIARRTGRDGRDTATRMIDGR